MCIFCDIIAKKEKAEIEYEDDEFIVIKDIYPKSPVHLLIIPKKHVESVKEAGNEDEKLLGKLLLTAKKVAEQKKLDYYNLKINVGRGAGQAIDHIHMHLESNAIRG
ncbi:MAG: HIT domain-containing protein [bacterium]|nr:HIT domain-containing protein [bacterium]